MRRPAAPRTGQPLLSQAQVTRCTEEVSARKRRKMTGQMENYTTHRAHPQGCRGIANAMSSQRIIRWCAMLHIFILATGNNTWSAHRTRRKPQKTWDDTHGTTHTYICICMYTHTHNKYVREQGPCLLNGGIAPGHRGHNMAARAKCGSTPA